MRLRPVKGTIDAGTGDHQIQPVSSDAGIDEPGFVELSEEATGVDKVDIAAAKGTKLRVFQHTMLSAGAIKHRRSDLAIERKRESICAKIDAGRRAACDPLHIGIEICVDVRLIVENHRRQHGAVEGAGARGRHRTVGGDFTISKSTSFEVVHLRGETRLAII